MKKYLSFLFFFSVLFFSQAFFVHAQTDFPSTINLTKLPGTSTPTVIDPKTTSPMQYINTIYNVGLAVGGILAIAMITAGGLMYSMSGAVDKRKEGKDMIVNSLYGLGILMGSYLILKTINPNLVTLVDFGEYFNEKLEVDGCPMGQATTTTEVFSNGVTSTQVICTSTGELFQIECGDFDAWLKIPQDPSNQEGGAGEKDSKYNNAVRGGVFNSQSKLWEGCTTRSVTLGTTDADEIEIGLDPFYNETENIDTSEKKRAKIWQYPYFIDIRDKTSFQDMKAFNNANSSSLKAMVSRLKWCNIGKTDCVSGDVFYDEIKNLNDYKLVKHPISDPRCIIYAYQEDDDDAPVFTNLQRWLSFCLNSQQSSVTKEATVEVVENGSESDSGQINGGGCPDENVLQKITSVRCENADCRLIPGALDGLNKALQIAQSQGESFVVTSAYRTWEKQTQLFNAEVAKRGSEAAARKWVAKPSCKAPHMQGIAVDIRLASMPGGMANSANMSGTDVNTKVMSSENVERVHKLWRIMEQAGWTRYKNEWWHFEYRSAIGSVATTEQQAQCGNVSCQSGGSSCDCGLRKVSNNINACVYSKYENGKGVFDSTHGCIEKWVSCLDSNSSAQCEKRHASDSSKKCYYDRTSNKCKETSYNCTDTGISIPCKDRWIEPNFSYGATSVCYNTCVNKDTSDITKGCMVSAQKTCTGYVEYGLGFRN